MVCKIFTDQHLNIVKNANKRFFRWSSHSADPHEAHGLRTSVCEVHVTRFSGYNSVRMVIFGSSSNVGHLSRDAFSETGIDSLYIPDSVVQVGEKCFYFRDRLRPVSFGASSRIEGLCRDAFSETGIESLYIPDSVVQVDEKWFSLCNSLFSVSFGASSRIEGLCRETFSLTAYPMSE